MAIKPILQTISGCILETLEAPFSATEQDQTVVQDYQQAEKFTHSNKAQTANIIFRAKHLYKTVIVLFINKIRQLMGINVFAQISKLIQLLRFNSRADAIDELKDIYSL